MLDSILGAVTNNSTLIVGGGASAIVLWALKKVPNEQIENICKTFFYGLGRTMTLGLGKWKFTKGVWGKTVEPYFIDLISNVVLCSFKGLISGLRSDNDNK